MYGGFIRRWYKAQTWEAPATGYRCLLLSEQVSSLDIHFQHQFRHIVQSLKKEQMILIVVLYDINLALKYADHVLFMKSGKIVRDGKVADIITAELVKEVFDIPVEIIGNRFGNAAMVDTAGKMQILKITGK